MGDVVKAVVSVGAGLATGGAASFIAPVLSSVVGSILAPDAPSPQAAPDAPEVAQAPAAPDVAKIGDIQGQEAATQAAELRARRRASASSQKRLISLSDTGDEAVSLTRSLLGE